MNSKERSQTQSLSLSHQVYLKTHDLTQQKLGLPFADPSLTLLSFVTVTSG